MTPDLRAKTYETYLSAWSRVSDDERARRLSEALSENVVFINSTHSRRGRADVAAHLKEFQDRSPGASFRTNEMLAWEDHGHVSWQLVDAQGKPGFAGHDVLAYDGHGLIESILMFVRVEKQLLK